MIPDVIGDQQLASWFGLMDIRVSQNMTTCKYSCHNCHHYHCITVFMVFATFEDDCSRHCSSRLLCSGCASRCYAATYRACDDLKGRLAFIVKLLKFRFLRALCSRSWILYLILCILIKEL